MLINLNMCYTSTLSKPKTIIEKNTYRIFYNEDAYTPFYFNNGFNHKDQFIIPQDDSKHIYAAKWGLVPKYKLNDPDGFYKDGKINTLNARSEDIFDKNTYKPHVHQRCLILADGFFEPHEYPDGSKQAYFCYIPSNNEEDGRKLFCMAGLYSSTGKGDYFTTLLTTEANEFFSEVHNGKNRMPLTLDNNYWNEWLNPDLSDGDVKELIKTGFTNDSFDAHPVTLDFYARKKGMDKNTSDIIKPVPPSYHPTLF